MINCTSLFKLSHAYFHHVYAPHHDGRKQRISDIVHFTTKITSLDQDEDDIHAVNAELDADLFLGVGTHKVFGKHVLYVLFASDTDTRYATVACS